MAGHSISRTTNSVIISMVGLPVVADTSLSWSVSTYKFTPACVPVMSESSRANMFSVPVMQTSSLRLSYDQDVLKHSNE